MTGARLRALRTALELELAWFASLLGLQAEKLERWESMEGELSLHPLQAHTLAILELQIRIHGPRAGLLGRRILTGIMLYGPPYGLLVLLQAHFGELTPEFVPSGKGGPPVPREPV